MEDSRVSTAGAGVSPVPRSSNQTQKLLETGSPNPSSSFQYQQSVNSRRDSELGCVESKDTVDKFWCLHSRVYNSLCERNVPVEKLVTYLLPFHVFDPVCEDSQKPALQTFFQKLRNVGSIETCFTLFETPFLL